MSVPGWFQEAIDTEADEVTVSVDGVDVGYRAAGPPDAPGLVFVHGATANAAWWWPVAARFADTRRVVALNLSGHGSSGRRGDYSIATWASEVAAVIEHAFGPRPVALVGHSVGGLVCIAVAAEHPALTERLLICDALLFDPGAEIAAVDRRALADRPAPQFASVAEARARFRTVPAQTAYADYVLDHVVAQSLVATATGWTWSFDRDILAQIDETSAASAWPRLRRVRCPLHYLRSEHGVTSPAVLGRLAEVCTGPVTVTTLAEAGHHPMLDRPNELYAALRTSLDGARSGG